MRRKHILAGIMAAALAIGMLGGCGSSSSDAKNTESSTAAAEKDTATSGTKKLVIGDTTFNPENAEADVNPHNDYSGWACIRYGIGETLVHYSDAMEADDSGRRDFLQRQNDGCGSGEAMPGASAGEP